MKILLLSLLAAVLGYVVGVVGGMLLINAFSSNSFDRSMEAAMTGAFVTGPLLALVSFIAILTYLLMHRKSS
jgi:hypothetical protein